MAVTSLVEIGAFDLAAGELLRVHSAACDSRKGIWGGLDGIRGTFDATAEAFAPILREA